MPELFLDLRVGVYRAGHQIIAVSQRRIGWLGKPMSIKGGRMEGGCGYKRCARLHREPVSNSGMTGLASMLGMVHLLPGRKETDKINQVMEKHCKHK